MKFRRFTPAGIAAARDYLAKAKAAAALDLPARDALIASPALTESIPALADLDFDPTRTFDTTFAFCEYFHSLIKDRNPQTYRSDVGFWTYLAIVFMEQLISYKKGKLFLGEEARFVYVPSDFTRQYRHMLAVFYYLYEQYSYRPEIVKVVLLHRFNVFGDMSEQFLSRLRLIQMPVVMATLDALYFDREGNKVKKGVNNKGAGSMRRLVEVFDQLSMTRDFYQIDDSAELVNLLPAEFSIYKEKKELQ